MLCFIMETQSENIHVPKPTLIETDRKKPALADPDDRPGVLVRGVHPAPGSFDQSDHQPGIPGCQDFK